MTAPSVDVVLTDVEGTTSAIAFVTRRLFPYARARLRAFLGQNAGHPEVRAAWEQARVVSREPLATAHELATQLERWSDEDRKAGPLKTVQGLLWEEGFRAGALRSHVYPDVPAALREWRARGLRLAVFSSGSVRAQRVFFAHTDHGDLSALFEAHFETAVGAKGESAAYRAIAASLGVAPERVLFLSDVAAELEAARAAGMRVLGLARDAASSLDDARFDGVEIAGSFDAIDVDHDPPRATLAGTRCAGVARLARRCYERGLVWATSGNFSARLSERAFAVTASGLDKGTVTASDLLFLDLDGRPLDPTTRAPSAETPLHATLYRHPEIGAVAHTHSVASAVLSRRHAEDGALRLQGYEMAKALHGVLSHEAEIILPIVPNDQDTVALARAVDAHLRARPAPAYLVEGHGLTTWGADLASVARHVEALEYLLACALAS